MADIDPDLEDERTTGSLDVEDRHAMARLTLEVADRVVVVGTTDTKGLHALRRSLSSILGTGISPDRVTVACNRASRRPRRRAEVVAALRDLLRADDHTTHLGNPVFLPERPDLEAAIRDGLPVPTRLGRTLHSEVRRAIDRQASTPAGSETDPQPVAPGSLGHFSEEAG